MCSKLFRLPSLVLALLAISLATACAGTEVSTPDPTPVPTVEPSQPPGSATPEPSFDAAEYFSDETIELFVGVSPGGGFDLTARTVATYLPSYFPGEPRFIVNNLPGSGHLRGIREGMSRPPEGLSASVIHARWVTPRVLGAEIDGFDALSAQWVGSATFYHGGSLVCARREYTTAWDEHLASGRIANYGTLEVGGGASANATRILSEVKNAPINMVFGYGGSSEVLAAFDRDELDMMGHCRAGLTASYPEWHEGDHSKAVPIYYGGADLLPEEIEYIETTLQWPIPPHVYDIAGVEFTDIERQVLDMDDFIQNAYHRSFAMHPDTPPEIVAVWRTAFEAMTQDPEFIDTLNIATGGQAGYLPGEDLEGVMREARELPPEGIEMLQWLNPEG